MTTTSVTFTFTTTSEAETMNLSEGLARFCGPGFVITLHGTLGAGKTHFVKGLARGLGVEGWRYVNSPTFTIVSRYMGDELTLTHIDLYRLENVAEVEDLGTDVLLNDQAVAAVEWPERGGHLFDAYHGFDVSLDFVPGEEHHRTIAVRPRRVLSAPTLAALKELEQGH